MNEIVLLKYGEIALKGLNRNTFEDILIKNIRKRLKVYGKFKITKAQSTIYIEPNENINADELIEKLSKVFGISKLCKSAIAPKDFDKICEITLDYLADTLEYARTFRVSAKRADKKFPMNSPQICCELGGVILDKYPHLKVSLDNADVDVVVEIRDAGAYIHAGAIDGAGGLPVGSSGNGLLLLSGGIDSPVAAYMMAKRGIYISAVHFVSPPYTSERARLKVVKLCEKLAPYCGNIMLFCVPFTEIQEAIRDNCPTEYFTIIMRRIMFDVAQRIAEKDECIALITGESVGQVASQTLKAMVCTDAACKMPVLRPVVGMDKTEIIEIARKIDTFETSVLPYEDCCTIFTPKHPKTKPSLEEIEKGQNAYNFEPLIVQAVENTTTEIISST